VFSPDKTGAKTSYLTAYALPSASCTSASPCTLKPIWSSATLSAAKFCIPATSNGWVYLGTRDGNLLGWAAPAITAPAQVTATNVGQAPVGSATSRDVTITARHTVTVTGVTASTTGSNAPAPGTQFTVGNAYLNGGATPVTFPVTLAKGDTLSARVTFTPTAPGAADGTVSFATTSPAFPTQDVAVVGEGTQPGLTPEPGTIQFMGAPDQGIIPVAVGISIPLTANLTNFGTSTVTVTSVKAPQAPFSASGLPGKGTQIKPGQTLGIPVAFTPTAAGSFTGTLTIGTSSGRPAVVTLSGVGTAAVSQVLAASPVVNFGRVRVGRKASAYIYITNSGNTQSMVKNVAPMPAPFKATLAPPAQMPFNPDSDLAIPVTFTPTRRGRFSTHYRLTWTDVNGTHTLTVTLTGTAV
jgi:hypothetical protein